MNRLAKCIKFQFRSMAISTLVFTAIYYGACILLTLFLKTSSDAPGNNSRFNSGFYIGCAIFAMVYVMSNYKSMYNFLMIFGNSRKNIFCSFAVTSLIMSAVLSLLSTLTQRLEAYFINSIGFNSYKGILYLIYENANAATELLYFAALFILISSFAMLYGALAYKLGTVFVTIFWIAFGFSFIFLPVTTALGSPFVRFLTDALTFFFRIGNPNGVLLAPVNFVITGILFAAFAYLLSFRQPQTA